MCSKKMKWLALFLLIINSSFANLIIFRDPENIDISTKISILEDKQNTFAFSEVLHSKAFTPNAIHVPNLGLTNAAFWIKIEVKNEGPSEKLLLELAQPIMDEVGFYSESSPGNYKLINMGEYLPFSFNRTFNDPEYIFPLSIPRGEQRTFFLKVRSKEFIQLPLVIGTYESVFAFIKKKDVLSGMYVGIMLVMLLYNLFIYFTVRDKSYLYYVVYIVLILLTQTSVQGYPFQYLWPNSPWMAMHSLFFFPALVGIAGMEFLKSFLHAKDYLPGVTRRVKYFYFVYFISISCIFYKQYSASFIIMEMNATAISLYMLYMAVKIYRKGYKPAKFFLLGWTVFLVGVCIYVFKDLGLLPYTNFTRYTMHTGSGIEVILLSFGLADRINTFKKEKEALQANALVILQENERIVKEQNQVLEAKVKERTEALLHSNKDLHEALSDLKDAQTQLVDSEKMASLGQLTAGIAHEINNPINFVISNINPLKRDIAEILGLIEKYEEIKSAEELEPKLQDIQKYKKEIDIDYLKEEIELLLKGIDEGAVRTSKIVKGLRNFSRLDEEDRKLANINEGLESTLTLLSNHLRGRVKLIKDFGSFPLVECYPGKLNQVFMNILNNAIQAVSQKQEGEGVISIKTFQRDSEVVVSIKDNGPGIPETLKSKIFEPFFTTKDVGEGTGLGLSIAYNIIEKHKGKILVESEPGKGAEFTIILPS